MTTYEQPSGFFKLVKLGFLLFLAVLSYCIIMNIINGTHAVDRHGTDAYVVRQNCENGNVVKRFFNPTSGKTAECVQLKNPEDPQSRKWGIRIVKDDFEVTSFIKDNMPYFWQIVRYLERVGYQPKK